MLESAHPGEQRVIADGIWVGVKAAKKKAGLPIGAHRISSAIGRSKGGVQWHTVPAAVLQ